MKIFECKCGSTDVFIEQQGNNCGLYCADCGKWITWLNKDSKRLAERQIKGIEQKIRNKAIDDFITKLDYESGYDEEINDDECIYEISRMTLLSIAERLKAGDTDAGSI